MFWVTVGDRVALRKPVRPGGVTIKHGSGSAVWVGVEIVCEPAGAGTQPTGLHTRGAFEGSSCEVAAASGFMT